MREEKGNQILHIAFITPNPGWIYQIKNSLDDNQRKEYRNSPLSLVARSIAVKGELLRGYVRNINIQANRANEILKANTDQADLAIKANRAYPFRDKYLLYSILGQTEAFLIELKSVLDLTIRYAIEFHKYILGVKKRKSEILEELVKNQIDTSWLTDLDDIRNDFIHNYSPWIKFRKRGSAYDFVIELPDRIAGEIENLYRRYPLKSLDAMKINDYVSQSDNFFNRVIDFLKKKVHK